MIDWLTFIAICACIWRIGYALINEMGPFDVLQTLRTLVGVHKEIQRDLDGKPIGSILTANNVIGKLFLCMWCITLWIALPFALKYAPYEWFTYTGAFAAGALAVGRLVTGSSK